MNNCLLEISQMLGEHPVLEEKSTYKENYINVLEHFVEKYSQNDVWATATLQLYKKKLLQESTDYQYNELNFHQQAKKVLETKFRHFKFFTYRYCLLFDCVFINAYGDIVKGKKIFEEILILYHKRYHKKIQQLFDFLYGIAELADDIDKAQYMGNCWNKNRSFLATKPTKVIVTANMSAGKSTLLNALVGKKVNKTQNDACTAKVHYIVNKPFEDDFCYELDYLLELDADYNTLMEDNKNNVSDSIVVGTYFRNVGSAEKRLWFVDTPGVNSSQDKMHKELAENTIKSTDADLLIYLLNGENIGTEDDKKHLLFILKHYHGKVLFVINKVDRYRREEDSVSKTIQAVIADLGKLGFQNPCVVPVSSYAAYLAKMSLYGETLNEDEQDEFDRMSRKLRKEEYRFDTYYPNDIQNAVNIESSAEDYQLLMHSGLLQLEQIIYSIR